MKSIPKKKNIENEDIIEREILKKMEKANEKKKEEIREEIKYENESIYDGDSFDTIDIHHNLAKSSQIESGNYNKKMNLYNEKYGFYQYQYCSNESIPPRKFCLTSQISKYLMEREECLNNIIENSSNNLNNKIDLNFSEFFNYRIFKYLDNYSDIYLNSSDLHFRQKFLNIYIFHILNHILKRNEEIEIGNKIEKLIDLYMNRSDTLNILKEDLFVNDDEIFLKNYLKECEIKNYASGKGEFFEEYRLKNKLKGIIDSHTVTGDNKLNFTDADYKLIRDQGFTSPRVLILVPNKKHAKLIVEELVNILRGGQWKGVSNKKKFKEEFSEIESLGDCFRLGINFDFINNKLRLYQSFDSSDIIIASPLGLKLTTVSDDTSVSNKKVYDFLSSIEILLVDFSEVFLYQNIEHLEEILSFLNKTPKNNQNIVSINRIKDIVVDNKLKYARQNIFISHFKNLEIEMLIKKYCKNLVGGAYIINEKCENILDSLNVNLNNDPGHRVDNDNVDQIIKYEFKMLKNLDDSDIFDYKFTYFTKNLWQSLYDTFERHTIIFVASTLDFLRLKKNSVCVAFLSEDTDKKDWQRNRLFFEEGKFKFLLYSERAHFYKKINLKFAKNIFFYSLPEDPAIFREMIELIQPPHYSNSLNKYKIEDKNELSKNYSAVIALVSKLEKYNLEKILGTSISTHILRNKLDSYIC